MSKVIIYTDGSCSMPSMNGGWGAVLIYGDVIKKTSGNEKNTTNNRMELMACIQALLQIKKKIEIEIYTDSKYVKNGITEWIIAWKKNGWKTASRQPVKNDDLWRELDKLNTILCPQWHWVRAHNGDTYNEIADSLAREEVKNNSK